MMMSMTHRTQIRQPSSADPATLLQDFLDHIIDYRDYSQATARAYERDCHRLMKFLEETDAPQDPEELRPRDIRLFLASLSDLSASSTRRTLYGISSFFEYLVNMEIIETNPAAPVDPPKVKRALPAIPTRPQCQRLIEACDTAREQAIIGLLLFAGLRRSELLGLEMADLAADLSMVTVRGKGGVERAIPVSNNLRTILTKYLQVREGDGTSLILNEARKRMGPTTLYRIFGRILERAGLGDSGITPHSLRHAFASILVREGVDVATISDLLGHSNIATTSVYLHATPEGKRAAVERISLFGEGAVEGRVQ